MTNSLVNADQNQIITFDHEVRGKFPLGKLVLTTSQVDPQLDRSVRAISVDWLWGMGCKIDLNPRSVPGAHAGICPSASTFQLPYIIHHVHT